MAYFYDYFAREYRKGRKEKLFAAPADMFQGIKPEDVQNCRRVLKNSFAGYCEGRNKDVLKRLLGEYREYVSCCHDGHAKERYNAFVYRYMVKNPVGSRAIAIKFKVTKETIWNYTDRCFSELLALCMGITAVNLPKTGEETVRALVNGSRLFSSMAGDYILRLFQGNGERLIVERSRQLTRRTMVLFAEAVDAYVRYCHDEHTIIDTDIRKAGILCKCLSGASTAAIAEEYGCCESTVYMDMRENERRLAAMLFGLA